MAARAVHHQGARRDHAVRVHQLRRPAREPPRDRSSSATSGARSPGRSPTRRACSRLAQRGTLFLDEVGEMSPWTQVKLLRALQERKVRRVGGTDEIPVDVRIIAATNQDLKKRIAEGKFREELFYRLNVISVDMPPLRKRVEDIPILIAHFLQKYCEKMGKKPKRFTPDVVGLLEGYAWPGNIRELENVIERIVAIEDRETVTVGLPAPGDRLAAEEEARDPGAVRPRLQPDPPPRRDHQEIHPGGPGRHRRQPAEGGPLLGLSYRTIRYLIGKYDLNQVRKAEKRNGNGDRNPA
ncbi:MAG: sigma 54-interacting transcriptional regulator [Desulfosudis oleivorans]|nr:sigma 54-interacting transcriptional regulator [Desulfosudis oleivorans]